MIFTGVLHPAILCLAALSAVQAPLPDVDEAELPAFRHDCRQLVATLEAAGAPLPAETLRRLKELLDKENGTSAEALQALLDPQCLIVVSINPESRVKAARGPGPARLMTGRSCATLIKVVNEGGVTHALAVSGPQLRGVHDQDASHWLEASVRPASPARKALTGRKLEYLILELTAHSAGKREATLRFDVGQGTQDLGFRAEVPVLFTVVAPAGRTAR
jgi:hypothetical protein